MSGLHPFLPLPTAEHRIIVRTEHVPLGHQWWAECRGPACGWVGPIRVSAGSAENDGDRHLRRFATKETEGETDVEPGD